MASVVGICNRALQKLGAKRITDILENSVNARACNSAYESIRDAELRRHTWLFSIVTATLAADAVPPVQGRAAAFQLPATCLKLLPPYPEYNFNSLDWIVEGRKIMTNDGGPLVVRYVDTITDPNQMDAAFREVLAVKLAFELCEEITQSNTKKAGLKEDYEDAIRDAKRANSFERVAVDPPDDTWITGRR